MKRIIICEDIRNTLIDLYLLVKKQYPDVEYILIKCDYNHNKSADQDEEKRNIEKVLENILKDEKHPEIRIASMPEDLLDYTYEDGDVFLLDISLFDGIDGKCNKGYDEYSSVKFAEGLVQKFGISKLRIRFYTRATSSTEINDFARQTDGSWRKPEVRPTDLSSQRGEQGTKIFLKKLLRGLEDQK